MAEVIADARLLHKAASIMATTASKETRILVLPGNGGWGDEPGVTDTLTFVAMNDTIGATCAIPVDGVNSDKPFQVDAASAKLIASICTAAIKVFDKVYKETETSKEEGETYPVKLQFNTGQDHSHMSVIPVIGGANGIVVSIDHDLSDAIPADSMKRLFLRGGSDTLTDNGSNLPSGDLAIISEDSLGTLVKVSKICGADIELYPGKHHGTTFRASCSFNSLELGSVLVSLYVTPSLWDVERDDLDSPLDVVEIPDYDYDN